VRIKRLGLFVSLLSLCIMPVYAGSGTAAPFTGWLAKEERLLGRATETCIRSKGADLSPLSQARALALHPGAGITAEDCRWFAEDCRYIIQAKSGDRLRLLKALTGRVGAYRRVWQAGPTPVPDAGQARSRLARILAGREFAWQARKPSWLQNTWNRIKDWWNRIWRSVLAPLAAPRFLAVLAVLAVLVMAFFAARALRGRPQTVDWDGASGGNQPEGPSPSRKADLLRQAQIAAGEGRFREALRYLYAAMLRLFAQEGVIRLVKYKTNWDYRREIGAHRRELAVIFDPFTALYEAKWYGQEECTVEHYDAARRLYDRAREAIH
jgi:hypothetical protein